MSVEVHPLFGSGGKPPESARDLVLHEIGVDLAMHLNMQWHSVLPKTVKGNLLRNKRKVFYALEFDGRFYAVAIWTCPIARFADGIPTIELRRLAICDSSPRNTATRMLSLMRKDIKKRYPELRRAVSYQALDHHHGTIYKADNWRVTGSSKFADWHSKVDRNPAQTKSDKVRWEKEL